MNRPSLVKLSILSLAVGAMVLGSGLTRAEEATPKPIVPGHGPSI